MSLAQRMAAQVAKKRKLKMSKGGEVDDMPHGTSFEDRMGDEPESTGPEKGSILVGEQEHPAMMAVIRPHLAKGGMVDDDVRTLGEIEEDGEYDPSSPERKLAQHLARGGLVVESHEGVPGNEPDLDWIDDSTSEPMSEEEGHAASEGHSEKVPAGPGLSDLAKKALETRKKKRRYASF